MAAVEDHHIEYVEGDGHAKLLVRTDGLSIALLSAVPGEPTGVG